VIPFPDITHHTFAITGAVGHEDNDRKSRYPVCLKSAITLKGMVKRSTAHARSDVFNPDPGIWIVDPQKPAPDGMGIMQQIVVEGPQIDNAVVIIIIRHLRIAKTGKICLTLSFCPFDLLRPVKRTVDHVDLTPWLQTGQAKMNDFF
jgi:hypothetical protein